MTIRPALPNQKDCEFLLYLIYIGDRGFRLEEFESPCQHYNRWTPSESTLRAALGRLIAHGYAVERDGVYFATPEIIERFAALPAGRDQFEDMEALSRLVMADAQE